MSRTKRKEIGKHFHYDENDNLHYYNHVKEGRDDKSLSSLKTGRMSAYVADKSKGEFKFVPELGRGTGISKTAKLVAKNANRALKKGKRQESKVLIKNELEHVKFDW